MSLGKIAESDWLRHNNFSNVNSGKPYAFRLRYKIAIYMDDLRKVYTELSLRLASTRMLVETLTCMAADRGISPAGHCGYVTFDEMAIQVRNEIYVLII